MQQPDIYSLDNVLSAFESLSEKGIDKLLNKAKEKIFGGELNSENINEFKDFVRKFYSLYYLMKDKFSEEYRSTGERYFEHLRKVVDNVLDLPNPNIEKVLIAIAHDSIEDTNKTYEGLAEDYLYRIALAVQAISKNPWNLYIEKVDKSITDEKNIRKKAIDLRNEDYFGHLESFDNMLEHIRELALSKNIILSQDELKEITLNALDVKFADRIHNLSTQWDPEDSETVRRKVDETKKYFLEIAKEVNIDAYNKLQSEILKLEIRLNQLNKKVVSIVEKN
ncbi:MAG: hypothetical protein PHS49_02465 [Candidatus Gracilibacteria bacterium]|nr:hypothetical protein [Candidatus Gracilibacteria bacterium]